VSGSRTARVALCFRHISPSNDVQSAGIAARIKFYGKKNRPLLFGPPLMPKVSRSCSVTYSPPARVTRIDVTSEPWSDSGTVALPTPKRHWCEGLAPQHKLNGVAQCVAGCANNCRHILSRIEWLLLYVRLATHCVALFSITGITE
jgi:hypothetical protein